MNEFILEKSVFLEDHIKPRVYLTKGDDPYTTTRAALRNIDLSHVKGKKVLIKPNVGRMAQHNSGVITNYNVVAAVIDAFNKAGAAVAVGESPITGVKTLEAFEESGIAAVARERNCPLIDMDERKYVPIDLPHGKAIKELKLCADILDFDIIVSVPVMKMHMHTGVTLAIKNMKGCLWRRSKVDLHMLPAIEGEEYKSLDIAIADMAYALRPHLSIIDGTIGMEGLGPSAGQPKPMGLVIVGADPFAADAVACHIMGTSAEEVPHLKIGADRGYGVIDLDQIEVFPENWKQYQNTFCPAPDNLSIEFPDVTILDKNSCSACQSTLLLFLKRYGERLFDYYPKGEPLHIAIGKGHDSLPEKTLCIGNCTAKHRDKNGNLFISGCPPVGSAIMKAIENDDAGNNEEDN